MMEMRILKITQLLDGDDDDAVDEKIVNYLMMLIMKITE